MVDSSVRTSFKSPPEFGPKYDFKTFLLTTTLKHPAMSLLPTQRSVRQNMSTKHRYQSIFHLVLEDQCFASVLGKRILSFIRLGWILNCLEQLANGFHLNPTHPSTPKIKKQILDYQSIHPTLDGFHHSERLIGCGPFSC